MTAYVVDTNVPIVANGRRSEQADSDCVMACIEALQAIYEQGVIVLDSGMDILTEYMQNINMSGQPGPGDAFMKWVWHVQADETKCERVSLTLRNDGSGDYTAFPNNTELMDFDRSDRKFVAVALASKNNPDILNAVDTDWADHHAALLAVGLSIVFLCPQHVCGLD